jgi:hypothetical protein
MKMDQKYTVATRKKKSDPSGVLYAGWKKNKFVELMPSYNYVIIIIGNCPLFNFQNLKIRWLYLIFSVKKRDRRDKFDALFRSAQELHKS